MTESTYWLWNGHEVEGPFTESAIAELSANHRLVADARVMSVDTQEWMPVENLLQTSDSIEALPSTSNEQFTDFSQKNTGFSTRRTLLGRVYTVSRNVMAFTVAFALLVITVTKFVVSDEHGVVHFLRSEDGKNLTNIGRGTANVVHSAYDPTQHSFSLTHFLMHWAYVAVVVAIFGPIIYFWDKYVFPKITAWDAERCLRAGDRKAHGGNYADAIKSYNSAIQNRPDLAQAYRHRAMARQALGDTKSADQDFRKAEELISSVSTN